MDKNNRVPVRLLIVTTAFALFFGSAAVTLSLLH
jgi:hypothetical protein